MLGLKKSVKIYSVKRLSDGEIFTVGDIVAKIKTWENYDCSIDSFIVKDYELIVTIKQKEFTSDYSLDGFYHYKQPIEDEPKYSKNQIGNAISYLFDPLLEADNSEFRKMLKEGYKNEFFKQLDK